MKEDVKDSVIKLRNEGFSTGEIANKLKKNKSTIYQWIKDIPFDKELQNKKGKIGLNKPLSEEDKNAIFLLRKDNLSTNEISNKLNISHSSIYRLLQKSTLPKPNFKKLRIEKWEEEAIEIFNKYKNDALFMLGIGLYWGEGSKSNNCLEICNSDSGVIKNWMKWCKTYIPNRKFQYKLNIHETSDKENALSFWEKNCTISEVKVYNLKKRTTKADNKVLNKMPNGVMYVRVCEGSLEDLTKMMKWLELLRNETE